MNKKRILDLSTASTRAMQIYMDVGVSLLRARYPVKQKTLTQM